MSANSGRCCSTPFTVEEETADVGGKIVRRHEGEYAGPDFNCSPFIAFCISLWPPCLPRAWGPQPKVGLPCSRRHGDGLWAIGHASHTIRARACVRVCVCRLSTFNLKNKRSPRNAAASDNTEDHQTDVCPKAGFTASVAQVRSASSLVILEGQQIKQTVETKASASSLEAFRAIYLATSLLFRCKVPVDRDRRSPLSEPVRRLTRPDLNMRIEHDLHSESQTEAVWSSLEICEARPSIS
jgi:hypothetical protein